MGSSRAKSILVVDDDAAVGESFAIFLTAEGYRTQIATNGEEALATMEEFLPDLVITDVIMPRMDGHALMAAMQRDARFAAIPVLLMSGAPDFAREAAAADEVRLQKPFSLEILVGLIEQMTARARSLSRAQQPSNE